MAFQHFTNPAQSAQKSTQQIQDGVYPFDDSIDQWCVVVGGQIVNYACAWSTAVHQFKEACRVRREHFRLNPAEVAL